MSARRAGLPVTVTMRHNSHYVEDIISRSGAAIGRMAKGRAHHGAERAAHGKTRHTANHLAPITHRATVFREGAAPPAIHQGLAPGGPRCSRALMFYGSRRLCAKPRVTGARK